jgi:hypothetical protein
VKRFAGVVALALALGMLGAAIALVFATMEQRAVVAIAVVGGAGLAAGTLLGVGGVLAMETGPAGRVPAIAIAAVSTGLVTQWIAGLARSGILGESALASHAIFGAGIVLMIALAISHQVAHSLGPARALRAVRATPIGRAMVTTDAKLVGKVESCSLVAPVSGEACAYFYCEVIAETLTHQNLKLPVVALTVERLGETKIRDATGAATIEAGAVRATLTAEAQTFTRFDRPPPGVAALLEEAEWRPPPAPIVGWMVRQMIVRPGDEVAILGRVLASARREGETRLAAPESGTYFLSTRPDTRH